MIIRKNGASLSHWVGITVFLRGEVKLGKYGDILSFISYFENESHIFYTWSQSGLQKDGFLSMAYPDYDEEFIRFIELVSDSGLMNVNYLKVIDNNSLGNQLKPVLHKANMEVLTAILTYFVRQERFCDGLWARAIEDKTFLNILYRLRELV